MKQCGPRVLKYPQNVRIDDEIATENTTMCAPFDGMVAEESKMIALTISKPILMTIMKWCIVGIKEWFQLQEIACDATRIDFMKIFSK